MRAFNGFDLPPLLVCPRIVGDHGGLMRGAFGGRRDGIISPELCRGEERLDGEIIALRKWLELVVMATRAAEGEPEKGRRGRVCHVVESIEAPLNLVGGVHHVRTEQIEAGGGERLRIIRTKLVARDLFAN